MLVIYIDHKHIRMPITLCAMTSGAQVGRSTHSLVSWDWLKNVMDRLQNTCPGRYSSIRSMC